MANARKVLQLANGRKVLQWANATSRQHGGRQEDDAVSMAHAVKQEAGENITRRDRVQTEEENQ